MNLQKQQTAEFDLHRQTRDIEISDTDYSFKYFMWLLNEEWPAIFKTESNKTCKNENDNNGNQIK